MLLVGALFLSSCGLWPKTHLLRYIMTVEVETPTGVRRGSGTIEIRIRKSGLLPGPPVTFGLAGEAVAIDLPNGQTLFALVTQPMNPDAAIHLPFEVFQSEIDRIDPQEAGDVPDWPRRVTQLTLQRPSADLIGGQRPFLVRFRDLARPETVEDVDPDRLSDAFGAGYRLRRITIAITDEPPSKGIAQRLPWLGSRSADFFRNVPTPKEPIDLVSRREFQMDR